jgi:hypothetical protein
VKKLATQSGKLLVHHVDFLFLTRSGEKFARGVKKFTPVHKRLLVFVHNHPSFCTAAPSFLSREAIIFFGTERYVQAASKCYSSSDQCSTRMRACSRVLHGNSRHRHESTVAQQAIVDNTLVKRRRKGAARGNQL